MFKKIKLLILQNILENYDFQYRNLIYDLDYSNEDDNILTKEEQEILDSLSNKIGVLEEIIKDIK